MARGTNFCSNLKIYLRRILADFYDKYKFFTVKLNQNNN